MPLRSEHRQSFATTLETGRLQGGATLAALPRKQKAAHILRFSVPCQFLCSALPAELYPAQKVTNATRFGHKNKQNSAPGSVPLKGSGVSGSITLTTGESAPAAVYSGAKKNEEQDAMHGDRCTPDKLHLTNFLRIAACRSQNHLVYHNVEQIFWHEKTPEIKQHSERGPQPGQGTSPPRLSSSFLRKHPQQKRRHRLHLLLRQHARAITVHR